MILTVKNWADFQHYKGRRPPWIKLHRGLLDDYKFHRLPIASKALAPFLWLLASEDEKGQINADIDELAFRFHMSASELDGAIKPLIAGGFFICLQPDSEPLAEPVSNALSESEGETEKETEEEKKDIAANAARDLEDGDAPVCSQLRTREGDCNQGTALAEHPGPNGSARSAGNSAIDAWNIFAERCGWPQVQQRSPERVKAGAARLGDLGGLDGWTIALGKAEASNFVRTQMTAFGYDWVTKRKNLTKLMEGNYDDRKSTGASHPNGHGAVAAFSDAAALLRDKQYSGL
jgi:hypothetical protein